MTVWTRSRTYYSFAQGSTPETQKQGSGSCSEETVRDDLFAWNIEVKIHDVSVYNI